MGSIVLVMPSLKISGGNKVFICLANELANSANVCLFYLDVAKQKSVFDLSVLDKSIDITPIRSRGTKFSKMVAFFRMFLLLRKHHRQSYIIVSDPILCVFLPLLSPASVFRFVQEDDYHLFDGHPKFNYLMNVLYKLSQKVAFRYPKIKYLVNSDFVREKIMYPPLNVCNDVTLYPNICPGLSERYIYEAEKANLNKKNKNEIIIGCVGRPQLKKGFNYFLDLIEALNDSKNEFRYKVMSNDDLSDFNLSEVDVVKAVAETQAIAFYRDCDIFVSTSIFEGFGMPALEAMACGCAVVLFDYKGHKEYTQSGKNSMVVAIGDIKAMKEVIVMLAQDGQYRAELVVQAKNTAKLFSWKNSAEAFMRAIGSVRP